jgi:hypothetical protein
MVGVPLHPPELSCRQDKTMSALDRYQDNLNNPLLPTPTCLICGLPPDWIGVFQPADPEVWGAPPGKTRLFLYNLCDRCRTRPGTPEKVEKVIFHEKDGIEIWRPY